MLINNTEYKILFPSSVSHLDKYFIVNAENKTIIQSEFTENRANDAVNVLNNHEVKNGRNAVYTWIKL